MVYLHSSIQSSEAIPTSGGANSGHAGVNDDGGSEGEEAEGEEGRKRRRRRMTARSVAMKVWQGVVALWNLAMSVNYTISIIVMMVSDWEGGGGGWQDEGVGKLSIGKEKRGEG